MRKLWWKLLGVLLVLFALVGGLFVPLKTGITGVRLKDSDGLNMVSGESTTVLVDIYNAGVNFKPEKAILKRDSLLIEGHNLKWDETGTLQTEFQPVFGASGEQYSGLWSCYVFANEKWMAFPFALSIEKGGDDTAQSASFQALGKIEYNPDDLQGFPNRPILNESIRNLLYHVPMWFTMIFVLAFAAWNSIRYLNTGNIDYDLKADALIITGILAGLLGAITGSIWAGATWDKWWPKDPKLNGVAIGMFMYLAYLLLRSGIQDDHQKARVSAVYNLFVYPIFIALILIMPKLAGDSLHPGAGGTVTFKQYDLDNTLRMFFYPAVAGWIMVFTWVASLTYRYNSLKIKKETE